VLLRLCGIHIFLYKCVHEDGGHQFSQELLRSSGDRGERIAGGRQSYGLR
jgi:hypothetical protein